MNVLQEMLSKRCHVALVLDENKKLLNIFNYYHVFQNIIGDEQIIKPNTDNNLNDNTPNLMKTPPNTFVVNNNLNNNKNNTTKKPTNL